MSTLTTDKHATYTEHLITTEDGIRHYAVIVERVPETTSGRFADLKDEVPFYVPMCELCDAYDAATSWLDFRYPYTHYTIGEITLGYPTCARCCSA